jgi:putative ABC transport system permease protein
MIKLKPSLPDLFQSSIRAILKNKIRTLLTSLGIIIGVSSVILLISIGNGLKDYVNQQFESLGSNTVYVSPGKIFKRNGGFNQEGAQTSVNFTQKDLNYLERNLKNVDYVTPMSQAAASVKYGDKIIDANLIVTDYQYAAAMRQTPPEGNGRWFSREEQEKNSKVVILGSQIADDLFKYGNPLGRSVIVKGKSLKIIGIMKKQGSGTGGPDFNSYAYVPLSVGYNLIGNENIQSIVGSACSKDSIESVKKQAEDLMLDRYDEDAFSVIDQSQILESINSILGTLTVALAGIAAISLVVGGIGIMNIMLVSVTERTREIGLRKAVGAYPRAILVQFLFEAVILSAVGGIIGIILGSLGALAINNFFPAKVTLSSVLLSVSVSSLVGIIFGVAPARKASKLSPIEALRYE